MYFTARRLLERLYLECGSANFVLYVDDGIEQKNAVTSLPLTAKHWQAPGSQVWFLFYNSSS